ncbi:MAG: glycosyltransferase N-terminal domain-containing protein, partial [Thermodesulfobacteriota bacterium]
EVNAAAPLVKGLKDHFPQKEIVFSTTTMSGFETAERVIAPLVSSLLYFPYDLRGCIFRVLDRIDPAMVVIVETDLWPNFLSIMRRKKVPVVLCNARLSHRSFKRYMRFPFIVRLTFDLLSFICPSSLEDAERLAALGIPRNRIDVPGNLKYDISHDPVNEEGARNLRASMGIGELHKILVAGSTHPGEEEILGRAFDQIRQELDHCRLIIVPRHPDRSLQVLKILNHIGLPSSLFRNNPSPVSPETVAVWVVNQMGLLQKIYEIADVVFVGGSLVRKGGHNPLEPAARSKPILFGPDMSDFNDVAQKLIRARGAVQVKDGECLARKALHLLRYPDASTDMGRNAYSVYCSGKGTVMRSLEILDRCL